MLKYILNNTLIVIKISIQLILNLVKFNIKKY